MSEAHMTEAERDIVGSEAALGYLKARRGLAGSRMVERLADLAMYTAVTGVAVTSGHHVAWIVALAVFAVSLPISYVAWRRACRADDAADGVARNALGLEP